MSDESPILALITPALNATAHTQNLLRIQTVSLDYFTGSLRIKSTGKTSVLALSSMSTHMTKKHLMKNKQKNSEMMKLNPALLLVSLLLSTSSFCQSSGHLTGTVLDPFSQPDTTAIVALCISGDSSVIAFVKTDNRGEFNVRCSYHDSVFIRIKSKGSEPYYSPNFKIAADSTVNLGTINLRPVYQTILEHKFKRKKAGMELEIDKTIYNIENIRTMQTANAYEIISLLPGVSIDKDGNICLYGKKGVTITVNGRKTGLNGLELINHLRSLTGPEILKIEILSNPSAANDASGSAGIINIVLKKAGKDGTSGQVFFGLAQGRYLKSENSANLNFKRKAINFHSAYTYSRQNGYTNLLLDRTYSGTDSSRLNYKADNYILDRSSTHTLRLGMNYDLPGDAEISVFGFCQLNRHNSNASDLTNAFAANNEKVYFSNFTNTTFFKRDNYNLNGEFKRTLDSGRTGIACGLNASGYLEDVDQKYNISYHYADGSNPDEVMNTIRQGLRISQLNANVDLSRNKDRNNKLEFGVKANQTLLTNTINFYDRNQFDPSGSTVFNYSEFIAATYINFYKKINKLEIQTGLRNENTLATGRSYNEKLLFNRKFIQLFPSLFLGYKIHGANQVRVNIGRRIDRPGYEDLNPYKRLLNPTTFMEGNVMVLPQTSVNFEVSYSIKNSLIIGSNYSTVKNSINTVLIQDTITRKTFQTVINLDRYRSYGLNLTYSKKINGKWTLNSNLSGVNGYYSGYFSNTSIRKHLPTFNFQINAAYSASKRTSIDGGLNYAYRNFYGITVIQPISNFNLNLQHSFLGDKATISLSFIDIFKKSYARGSTETSTISENWSAKRDTRMIRFNFIYKLNGRKK